MRSELHKEWYNAVKNANTAFFRDKHGLDVDEFADGKHTFAIEIKSMSGCDKKLSSGIRKYSDMCDKDVTGREFYPGDET